MIFADREHSQPVKHLKRIASKVFCQKINHIHQHRETLKAINNMTITVLGTFTDSKRERVCVTKS